MKKGFTASEKKQFKKHLDDVKNSLDSIIEFLREKHEKAEDWAMERSLEWQDSDKSIEFSDWLGELDYKTDEIEDLKSDFDLDNFDEIL